MRLTALRQSPKDVSGSMNPRQMIRKSTPTDLSPPHICCCKHPFPESEKCWRVGQYATLQGGAVHAPHNTDMYSLLPKLTTRNTWTRRDHLLHNPAPSKKLPPDTNDYRHSTLDRNPSREEDWQPNAATIREGGERLSPPPGGSATHSSLAHDIYGKAPLLFPTYCFKIEKMLESGTLRCSERWRCKCTP
jgi:hypothetical protein